MRLFVMVQGDEIIVTSETGFRVEYWKRPNHSQLKVRRCTETENNELPAYRKSLSATSSNHIADWELIDVCAPTADCGLKSLQLAANSV